MVWFGRWPGNTTFAWALLPVRFPCAIHACASCKEYPAMGPFGPTAQLSIASGWLSVASCNSSRSKRTGFDLTGDPEAPAVLVYVRLEIRSSAFEKARLLADRPSLWPRGWTRCSRTNRRSPLQESRYRGPTASCSTSGQNRREGMDLPPSFTLSRSLALGVVSTE